MQDESGRYQVTNGDQAYLELSGIEGASPYLYLDIDCLSESGGSSPFTVKFAIEDEGNCYYYFLPETTSYSVFEKTKYFHVHSYGDIHKMRIYFWSDNDSLFTVNRIVLNVRVPFFLLSATNRLSICPLSPSMAPSPYIQALFYAMEQQGKKGCLFGHTHYPYLYMGHHGFDEHALFKAYMDTS